MLNKTKKLLRLGLRRRPRFTNSFWFRFNNHRLSRRSNSLSKVYLQPIPPDGGNVAHFYHFIFDLALPLYFLTKKLNRKTTLYVDDFGPASQRLLDLFPERVVVQPRETAGSMPILPMVGMNPKLVDIPTAIIDEFVAYVWQRLGCRALSGADKLLLVERLPPTGYFSQQSGARRSGAERRAIRNHAELARAVGALARPELDFMNVQLETVSLKEQIEIFNKAKIVLAQHGAALANCLWMDKRSIIVERNSEPEADHFVRASKLREHKY